MLNGQRGVGGGHFVHVVRLARGGALAMELLAIPGGLAAGAVGGLVAFRNVGLAHHRIRTIGRGEQGLIDRHGVRNGVRVVGQAAVSGTVVFIIAAALGHRDRGAGRFIPRGGFVTDRRRIRRRTGDQQGGQGHLIE